MDPLIVREAQDSDVPAILEIYNPYITRTAVSFEEEPVTEPEMRRRIEEVQSYALPWLCAELDGRLAGYAYATRWRERSAYRFTAETTIYLAEGLLGRGFGNSLYSALLDRVRAAGMHQVMAVITLPNPASVRLHEKLGYVKVAHFSQVGYKFDRWLDVGYWQLAISTE